MPVVWNHTASQIGQESGWDVLNDALTDGAITGGSTNLFHVKPPPPGLELITFYGNFNVVGGFVVSGTITGFTVFYGNGSNKLIEATGYAIDFNAFSQALSQFKTSNQTPLYQLLLGEPMTVNGADDPASIEQVVGGFADDTIFGNGGGNFIYDLGGSDVMYGGPTSDLMIGDYVIFGGVSGNDAMYGGGGDDKMEGGAGDDFMSGGPGMDDINGNDGSDTADYSEKIDRLTVKLDGPNEVGVEVSGFVEDTIASIENINGGSNDDKIVGDGFANTLVGNGGNDNLKGKDGNDMLFGVNGRDKINGGRDDDTLSGGKKKDNLKGGQGDDAFLFDVKPKGKHADKIKDFKGKDMIGLDADVFTKVNDSGKLKKKYFVDGSEAKDKNDYLIYDDGALYYDRDGSGSKKGLLVAKLKGDPDLDAGDIFIF